MNSKGARFGLFWFALALSLFRLLWIGSVPLSPDEAYYWTWSLRPAVSYFDQPGLIAWVHWFFHQLFSNPSAFTVRLPAVIFGFFTTVFAGFCYQELFQEKRDALVFAFGFSFIPLFFFSEMVMIHDTVLIFFLLGFYLFCFRVLRQASPLNWLGLSFFLLGSLYSKLNAFFSALGFALYLFLSPLGRSQLKKPWVWFAGFLTLMGFLPVIIWNQRRGWPLFLALHQLVRSERFQLFSGLLGFFEYLVSQFAIYSPLFFLGLLASLVLGIKELAQAFPGSFRAEAWGNTEPKKQEKILLLLSLSLPSLFYFALLSFRDRAYANWSLVGYFPAFLLFGYFSLSGLGRGRFLNRRFWYAGALLSIILCLLVLTEVRFRFLRTLFFKATERFGARRELIYRFDLELEGWEELVGFIEKNRRSGELISTRRYQIASILGFYLKDHPIAVVISAGHKQSQFNLWRQPSELRGQGTIYVDTSPMPEKVKKGFSSLEELAVPLIIYREQIPVKKFFIYRGFDYRFLENPEK